MVTSIFSFYHNVFKVLSPRVVKKTGLFGNGFKQIYVNILVNL